MYEDKINFDTEKVYFAPGDLVKVKHNLPNAPVMMVKGKETKMIKKDSESSHFKGIRCVWFTSDYRIQEAVFSTKDLKLIGK